MTKGAMRGLVAFWMMVAIATAAIGDTVYKWVDERGVTHYSQSPPANQRSRQLELDPARPADPAQGGPAAGDSWRKDNAEFQRRWEARRKAEEEEARSKSESAETRELKCEKARAELARLMATKPAIKGRPTVSLRDPQSEEEVELMNNAERTTRINDAEQAVRDSCD